MQVVFNREVAEQLRARYTVLDLEQFTAADQVIDAFCVVPAEKLAFLDLSKLQDQIKTHEDFVAALKSQDWAKLIAMYDQVRGSFAGELDSFYGEIVSRANLYITD
jgi:hypothetical protein